MAIFICGGWMWHCRVQSKGSELVESFVERVEENCIQN